MSRGPARDKTTVAQWMGLWNPPVLIQNTCCLPNLYVCVLEKMPDSPFHLSQPLFKVAQKFFLYFLTREQGECWLLWEVQTQRTHSLCSRCSSNSKWTAVIASVSLSSAAAFLALVLSRPLSEFTVHYSLKLYWNICNINNLTAMSHLNGEAHRAGCRRV